MKTSDWITVGLETSTIILPLIVSPFVKVFFLLIASYSMEKFLMVIFPKERSLVKQTKSLRANLKSFSSLFVSKARHPKLVQPVFFMCDVTEENTQAHKRTVGGGSIFI